MEVPRQFLELLASTLSSDQSTRIKGEEQLSFLVKNEQRILLYLKFY